MTDINTNIKEINNFTRQISVNVPWEELKEEFQNNVNEVRKSFSFPGYRKGKVPMNIVKKNIGPKIEFEFGDKMINKYYYKSLTDLKLIPINQAKIEDLSFSEGNNLVFTATFEITPKVTLPGYEKKFKINSTKYTSTDVDIENELKKYQEQFSTVKEVETGAKKGHYVQGDFQELDENGIAIIGKKLENRYIQLGDGAFGGDVLTALKGTKAGETVKISPKYDDSEICYEVTIHKIEEQILPKLDDDFAKTVDASLKTLNELKDKVKANIDQELDNEYKKQIRQLISDYFVTKSTADVPVSMKEHYLNGVIDDVKKQNHNQEKLDDTEIRKAYDKIADWNIKWHLIREELLKKEAIEITENDIKNMIDEVAEKNPDQAVNIKKFYKSAENKNRIKEDLSDDKLYEKLITFATIKTNTKTMDELRKEQKKS
ncbi:MAG: trigger factor [Candidatus Marinimicrobia bacterium]|nr:trigger factor [Candidatus Neomarinimicrobiota bacterium]MBL7023147.1 trigger factor [Candidatus Neomarinimicrobiota bacterium]MBL7109045.1 trigger factor [Candidatus Neomarinimicrobiota bacterium]